MSFLKSLSYLLLMLLVLQAAPLRAADTEDEETDPSIAAEEQDIHSIVPSKGPAAAPLTDVVPAAPVASPKIVVPAVQQHFDDYGIAVLQELDKMNAHVQKVEVPINKPVQFGVLQIEVKACRKTPPEDPPESAAYIEIKDTRYQEKSMEILFHGWMFASSPALSALENPNYDVWVLDCKNAAAKESSPAKPKSSPKKAAPDKASPKSE